MNEGKSGGQEARFFTVAELRAAQGLPPETPAETTAREARKRERATEDAARRETEQNERNAEQQALAQMEYDARLPVVRALESLGKAQTFDDFIDAGRELTAQIDNLKEADLKMYAAKSEQIRSQSGSFTREQLNAVQDLKELDEAVENMRREQRKSEQGYARMIDLSQLRGGAKTPTQQANTPERRPPPPQSPKHRSFFDRLLGR